MSADAVISAEVINGWLPALEPAIGTEPFVILAERRAPNADDLIVHPLMLSADAHIAAGQLNEKFPDFIGGLLGIQFNGNASAVALVRATRAQIDKARLEGRL